MFLEDWFIYHPEREGRSDVNGRAPVEDRYFSSSDGLKLHGWMCAPHPVGPVLLWFHGNGGNISHRYELLVRLCELPARVFVFDYRGYGKSEGRPSEEGLYRDGQAAWDYLTRERNVPSNEIVFLGKSLGGAVAIDLATRVRPAGLIVQSSFTSIPDMAAVTMPWVPRFLIRTKMNSLAKIGRVSCPTLFVHSRADEVVPFEMGRRLFEAAGEPKQFLELAEARHNETFQVGGGKYFETLRTFFGETSRRASV